MTHARQTAAVCSVIRTTPGFLIIFPETVLAVFLQVDTVLSVSIACRIRTNVVCLSRVRPPSRARCTETTGRTLGATGIHIEAGRDARAACAHPRLQASAYSRCFCLASVKNLTL